MNAAAYDPASTRVVTADGDGTARIFSTASRGEARVAPALGRCDWMRLSARTVGSWPPRAGTVRSALEPRWRTDPYAPARRGGGRPRVLARRPSSDEHDRQGDDVHLAPRRLLAHWCISTPGPCARRDQRRREYAVVFGADRFARVYDVATGALLFELEHHSQVLSAVFGRRKEMLVTAVPTGRRRHGISGEEGPPTALSGISAVSWTSR